VVAQSDWTVGRLKEELEKRFPGKIPASLQRLFKGTQLLPSSKNRLDSVPSAMVPHEWELGGRLRTEKSCAFRDCDDC